MRAEPSPQPATVTRTPATIALRACGWYLALGLGWIWVSDLLLWGAGLSTPTAALASAAKGSLFLVLFGVLLYRLVRNHLIDDARLAQLVESVASATTDPIFVQDGAGRFVFANAAAARCLGRPVAEVLGRTVLEACGPDIAARLDEFRRGAATGSRGGELAVGGPDGRAYLVSVSPFGPAEGTGPGCVVVCHDVTDRRRDERALAASEERYRAYADHAADAFFLQAEGGRMVDVNARACESLGYSRGELVGETHRIFTTLSEDRVAALAAVVRAGEAVEFEDVHRRKDGTTFPVEVRMKRVRVGGDQVVLSTARDLTRRRRAEDAQRRADDQRVAILQALPAPVALLDPAGTIITVNEAWRRFAPASALTGEAFGVGVNYADVCERAEGGSPGEARQVAAGLRGVLDRTQSEYRVEYPCHDPREERWFELVATPVPSGGAVVMHVEVTARHRAEQADRQQAEGFRLLSEVAERLLAGGAWPDMAWDVCARAAGYLGCDAFLSFRYNGTELELDLAEGVDPAARDQLARLPLGAELCGWCAKSHETLYVPDLQSSPDPRTATVRTLGLRCYVAFPLLAGDRLLGTVSFASRSRTAFGPHERAFARTVGHYLATALERFRVEAEVREGEERYRAVVDHAADAIFLLTTQCAVVDANPAACESLGYTRRELVGMSPAQFDAAVGPAGIDEMRANIRNGGTTAFETVHRRKDGTTFPVELRSRLVAIGGREYCLSVARDVTERNRAEVALRESEAKFRTLFETSGDAIFLMQNDRFIECNARTLEMFGCHSRDQIVGQPPYRFSPPKQADGRGSTESALDKIAAALGGRPQRFEWTHTKFDGTPFSAEVSLNAVVLGGATLLQAIVRDVTERRRAEAALRESEERYRLLVEVLPAGVFIHTAREIVFCNPAFVRLMGATRADELLGRDPFGVPDPDHREFVRARVAAMCASGEASTGIEMRVVRLDGRTVSVDSSATPISGYGPSAVLVAMTDQSERERSTALLRTVLGSVGDAILTIDTRGRVASANPATERLFGYPEAELVGQNVRTLMPEPDRGRHDGYIANYLRTGRAKVIGTGRDVDGRRKDGTTFPAELTVTEFRLDGERHFTGVIRDITARRKLEDQFRQAQKMEAVGRLAGGVAHDFNNLLTVINGYSDLLLATVPHDHPHRVALAAVRDAGDRAAALTSQLLAFSRKTIVAPKVFDLRDAVTQSERLLRRLIGEDVVLTVVSHAAPCRVTADPNQVDQVVMNLAVNARDAMPTGGRLTIETRRVTTAPGDVSDSGELVAGAYVELTVADTGCGMADDVKARIFEPFFTTKEVGKGTGLGLAVVYGMVKQANGHVSVESAVGRGTTFRILFPEAPAPDESGAVASLSAPARGTEAVLLVEDDDAVRTLSALALESQGYTVRVAATGRAALQLLRTPGAPKVDLLVTDVVMPEMSGRELADAARAVVPGLRVLFVSGYTDDEVFRHGVRGSTDAFLQKPFSPMGLARKAREVLDKPD